MRTSDLPLHVKQRIERSWAAQAKRSRERPSGDGAPEPVENDTGSPELRSRSADHDTQRR
jgi:hypothetical protein